MGKPEKSSLLKFLNITKINEEGDLVPKSQDCHIGDKLVCSQALICRSACESLLREKDLQGGLLMIVDGEAPELEKKIIEDRSKCASDMLLFDSFKKAFDLRQNEIRNGLKPLGIDLEKALNNEDVLWGVLRRIPITEEEAALWRKAYKKYKEYSEGDLYKESSEEYLGISIIKKIVDIKFPPKKDTK